MKYYKKAAAFSLGLLVAVSAVFPAVNSFTAYADDDVIVIDDDGNVMKEEVTYETIESGDFKYYLDDEGKAWISSCSTEEESFTLPENIDGHEISGIEGGAFQYLNAKKIIIPASVSYDLSANPFAGCLFLEEIEADKNNETYCTADGVLYSKDKKILYSYPIAKEGKSFDIPEGTEEIGLAAFYAAKIEKITVPSSVCTLNRHCFSRISASSIDLSNTEIEIIPPMAFVMCDKLTEIIFPETVYEIQIGAFMDCSALEEVNLPEYLETVGQSAFQGTAMTRVLIPEYVTSIGYNAFGYIDEETPLDEFTIIGYAGSAAAMYCTDSDSEYDYSNNFSFMTIANYYRQLQLESMDVKVSGEYTYSVKEDGTAVLVGCASASSRLELPAKLDGYDLTSIYYGTLQGCPATEIIIPSTVTVLGETIFPSTVEKITLSGNLQEIEGTEPFLSYIYLTEISVGEGDGAFSSENGILYNKDKTSVIAYPQAKEDTSVKLPSTVKEVQISSFCYNPYLTEIDLSSVETIGDYAFEGCEALTSVKLSKNLQSVGTNAFLGCEALTGIRVYDKLNSISEYAFGYTYDDELAADMEANPDNYINEDGTYNLMPYSVIEGFKMYVSKDSLAYQYATDCGIETVTDTVEIGNSNVDMKLFYIIGGLAGAGLLGILVKFILSLTKKKKKPAKK